MIGLMAGLIGGLLGIGGSIVMIPAMTELLGAQQHLYQATAMIVNFFVAASALVQHLRVKAVDTMIIRQVLPWAILAAVTGVACSELPAFRGDQSVYLTGLFGGFLFLVAARDVIGLVFERGSICGRADGEGAPPFFETEDGLTESSPSPLQRTGRRWRVALLVGLPTGFTSGLLGVGGGVLAVPLLRRFCRVPMPTAIANSAAMIVVLSLVGAICKHYSLAVNHPELSWHQPVVLGVFLIPTAMVGASIGGRLTHVLPLRMVRSAFVILLVVAGARMVYRTIPLMAPASGDPIAKARNGADVAPPSWISSVRGPLLCKSPIVA